MEMTKTFEFSEVEVVINGERYSVDFTAYCKGRDDSTEEWSEPEELINVDYPNITALYKDVGSDVDMEEISLVDISDNDYNTLLKKLEEYVYDQSSNLDWFGATKFIYN